MSVCRHELGGGDPPDNSNPVDAHCCHVGTAIKHPVPDRVNPSFVIFDIRALWCSECPDVKN